MVDNQIIEELTPEQEAMLPVVRDEWLAVGLSTEPANREAAEAGARLAYEKAGLTPPEAIYWEGSPYAGCVKAAQLLAKPGTEPSTSDIRSQIYAAIPGQHDSSLSFYDFFARIGLEAAKDMDGLIAVARNAGWWWAFDEAIILTERPNVTTLDPQGQLHNETGPAVKYPDGWGLWAWHGVRVPKSLIEDGGWSSDQILREPNAEIRRCAIERVGWDRFIAEAKLKRVGKEMPDPGNPGKTISLYDVPEQIFEEPVRVLLCTNGTPERDGTVRRFGLTVPASCKTPLEAAAWGYDVPVEVYEKVARRT